VLEPLSGYLLLAERLYKEGQRYAGSWNFGPDAVGERPVQAIVEQLAGLWGEGARWKQDCGHHPHEASYLKLDCSKARKQLDWHPVWSLEQTLERIVRWHKAWLQGSNMHDYTCAEINDYMRGRNR
jgi:CDP-glucose 4,6-dehydratase